MCYSVLKKQNCLVCVCASRVLYCNFCCRLNKEGIVMCYIFLFADGCECELNSKLDSVLLLDAVELLGN